MENLNVNSSKLSGKGARKVAPTTTCHHWSEQYKQLQEQGEQLQAACAGHISVSKDATRDARSQTMALQQLRAQLAKQVQTVFLQLQGIESACHQQNKVALQRLDKHLIPFETSLSSLQSLCATQLEQLSHKETAAASEVEAASRGLRIILETQAIAAQTGIGPDPQPAKAVPMAEPVRKAALQRKASSVVQSDVPPEVKEHDEFLQRHGPTGGWHPDDHAEFERILQSCRGIYSHAVQISSEQLGLLHSRDDIIRHARWHEELQDLQTKKRQAIQQWRMQKAARQMELLQQDPEQSSLPATTPVHQAMQQQREQQKLAVLEWKRSKELQQRHRQQREQEEQRQQQERERQARQQRQRELGSALAEYKQRKAEQYEQHVLAAERAPSSRPATADPEAQRRLAERNQQLLTKRQELVQRRVSQAQKREARLQHLQEQASSEFLSVERDPTRVLQATAAAQLRHLAITTEERGYADSGWIRRVQHKATPSWCRDR